MLIKTAYPNLFKVVIFFVLTWKVINEFSWEVRCHHLEKFSLGKNPTDFKNVVCLRDARCATLETDFRFLSS